jgi:hypothetical protein
MIRLTALLAALAVAAPALSAQSSTTVPERQGFGISFGFGAGSAGADCDFCSSERTTGLSGYLRLGGHVNQQLFLGVESNGWTKEEEGVTESLGFYSGVLQWYPNVASSFYLKGGVGLATYLATDDIDEITSNALGLTVGMGYDLKVGQRFSLTPFANAMFSTKGELNFNDESTGLNVSANLIQVGLGFTWH